jgi:hypothetical protein
VKDLRNRAEGYLTKLDERLGPFIPRAILSLPLYLRERFSVFSARVFGRNWLLAIEEDGWDAGTPTEYRQHWQQLKKATGEEHVAFVLPSLSATVRNRMIGQGVPFLIPDTQIFLPESITLLRENFATLASGPGKSLSPPAQVLLLLQVQQGGLEELSAKELSARLGFCRASMSNATSELEQNNLCETSREGKEQRIHFKGAASGLWESALPLLRSPVSKTLFVRWSYPVEGVKRAGISALAQRSQLAEDSVPVFAMPEKRIRMGLEHGQLTGCVDRYEANAEVEAWRYDPALLSDGPDVDPLSLFLSLRNSPDERVQAELADMMEALPWR